MACSHLATEEDVFSASQVCHRWRGVLISSPSLWTRFSCHRVSRTITSLERCKYLPIQLELDRQSSNVALESVLLCENKISSLAMHDDTHRIPSLHQLFMLSRPSVERLHVYSSTMRGWIVGERSAHEIWQGFPSLRELFVSRYSIPIDRLTTQNLAHLALEETKHQRVPAAQYFLDLLRVCPLLETLLIIHMGARQKPTCDHSPVSLPRLRSIEVGLYEVCSGLITHLQLLPNVAAGFRMLHSANVSGNIPLEFVTTAQHVLRWINIRCVTLAVPLHPQGGVDLLIRLEGLQGSLEITIYGASTYARVWDVFFGPRGVLFSHSPRIEDVRELHIVGCSFEDGRGMDHISAAMPGLTSISFFHCEGPHVFGLLTPTNPSSPPFPHLERVMVLGPESGLRAMAETRRDHGVPLKTLAVGRGARGFEYDHLEDYTALEEFVDELRIGCPAGILGWGAGNEILSVWSTVGVPGPVSPNEKLMLLG